MSATAGIPIDRAATHESSVSIATKYTKEELPFLVASCTNSHLAPIRGSSYARIRQQRGFKAETMCG